MSEPQYCHWCGRRAAECTVFVPGPNGEGICGWCVKEILRQIVRQLPAEPEVGNTAGPATTIPDHSQAEILGFPKRSIGRVPVVSGQGDPGDAA